ncbi:FtsH protease activity modulator HflK [Thiolinea disciformis]|uniref:FtsH protease activity modulator HflK n=1 Tax=Thiolinea disciformis TaxID=125614 RepID=UPI00037777AF|nr:FtsH protease activity modulator HflK [Thiolinea disciformis]
MKFLANKSQLEDADQSSLVTWLSKRIGSLFSGSAILLLIIAMGLWMSWYTVPSDSVGMVQRFGKYISEVPSGLHFKIPFGVDTVTILPVKRQLKQEFGFGTVGATNADQYSNEPQIESSMVTGDLNAASVEWVVQYRITEPQQYLFQIREPSSTLRDVSESVMREVVGDRTVDEVITIGRQEIEVEALRRMQVLAKRYDLGIGIDQVQLKNVNPPDPVRESFNEVNQAQQEKERLINEARRDYNKVIPLVEGQKDQRIREAEGYKLKRVNEAEGDVARFNAVFAQYQKAPAVTKQRLYLETMQAVLPNVQNKIIVDSEMQGLLPLLNLTKTPVNRTTPAAAPPMPNQGAAP